MPISPAFVTQAVRSMLPWLTLAAMAPVYGAPGDIEGCWQTLRFERRTQEGKITSVPSNCRVWYGDNVSQTTCIDAADVVTGPVRRPYAITPDGQLRFPPEQAVAYRVAGDTLITHRTQTPEVGEDGHTYVAADSIAKRHPARSAETCLLTSRPVSEDEHLKYFDVQQLVLRMAQGLLMQSMAMGRIGPSDALNTLPRDQWSPSDLQRALKEFTGMLEAAALTMTRPLRDDPMLLKQAFFSPFGCAGRVDTRLASPRVQAWSMEASRLLSTSMVIEGQLLTLHLLQSPDSGPVPAPPANDKAFTGLDSDFDAPLRALASTFNDAALVHILPDGRKLGDLQRRANLLDVQARAYGMHWNWNRACLNRGIQQVWQLVQRSAERSPEMRDAGLRLEEDVRLLALRLAHLRQPPSVAACPLVSAFDRASLDLAKGDWTKVRAIDRRSVGSSADLLYQLHWLYESRCPGLQDVPAARRVLERIAVMDTKEGLTQLRAMCKLSLWARYGIGGKADPAAADQLLVDAKVRTGANCFLPDLPPIDPADPWRVIRREHSPGKAS